jgi:RES domain-containing protein
VVREGRDPLLGSSPGGRWSVPGGFEVLYTSLSEAGALAEIGYRLSLEPVWPSRLRHTVHRIAAVTERTLRLATLSALTPLGVDAERYRSFDYGPTRAVAAAAQFLGFDGMIVPSARAEALNLVVFLEGFQGALRVEESGAVDWDAWRGERREKQGGRSRPP